MEIADQVCDSLFKQLLFLDTFLQFLEALDHVERFKLALSCALTPMMVFLHLDLFLLILNFTDAFKVARVLLAADLTLRLL